MNWLRLLVAALGVAAFGVAAVVVLVPGAGSILPADAAVEALGYDYLLVALVGVVAFVVTLVVVALRAAGGLDRATPPDPEGIETVPRLGADVDAIVEDGLGLRERLFGDGGEQVRERIRETAVRTVSRVEHCDHAAARRRVDRGSWTDDREAAAFLAEGGDAPGTWRTRLLAAVGGESPLQRGARRSIRAIVALAEGSDASAYRDLPAGGAAGANADRGGRDPDGGEGTGRGRERERTGDPDRSPSEVSA